MSFRKCETVFPVTSWLPCPPLLNIPDCTSDNLSGQGRLPLACYPDIGPFANILPISQVMQVSSFYHVSSFFIPRHLHLVDWMCSRNLASWSISWDKTRIHHFIILPLYASKGLTWPIGSRARSFQVLASWPQAVKDFLSLFLIVLGRNKCRGRELCQRQSHFPCQLSTFVCVLGLRFLFYKSH